MKKVTAQEDLPSPREKLVPYNFKVEESVDSEFRQNLKRLNLKLTDFFVHQIKKFNKEQRDGKK